MLKYVIGLWWAQMGNTVILLHQNLSYGDVHFKPLSSVTEFIILDRQENSLSHPSKIHSRNMVKRNTYRDCIWTAGFPLGNSRGSYMFRWITRFCRSRWRKMKKILAISIFILTVLGFIGVKVFDVTLFNSASRKSNVENEPGPEISLKTQLPKSSVEEEPIPEPLPQQTRDNEVEKLPLSKFIGILNDLPSPSDKLEFIENNMDFMPTRFSLGELHQVLALFSRASDRSTIIKVFLSRLPDSLLLGDLNRILSLFSRVSDKLKATRMFLSRLESNYSDSEFESFKNHYTRSSEKMVAINLLLRNQ